MRHDVLIVTSQKTLCSFKSFGNKLHKNELNTLHYNLLNNNNNNKIQITEHVIQIIYIKYIMMLVCLVRSQKNMLLLFNSEIKNTHKVCQK